ncbi:MAG TPA: fluoride efflux transporter CrcB [Phototrophicaceae bacterium]|nr:fluoride efflux transporter CrcB [Phototrophicaceae bacterium]
MAIENLLIVGIGGVIGANLRYLVSVWANERFGAVFPWATLMINFTGSCLLAAFLGFAAGHIGLDPNIRLLFATGFCGAYTTYSTYITESIMLLRSGDWIGAAANILGMNLLCLIGALLGFWIGSQL